MRLIDADALKDRFKLRIDWLKKDVHDECSKGLFWGAETDVDLIDEMPTVDAEPVRHAKVVTVTGRYHMMHQECSYCGGELRWKEYPIYCPNCGAKMDEGKENEDVHDM